MEAVAEVSNMDVDVQSVCLRHNPDKCYIEKLLSKGCQLHCNEHASSLICLLYRGLDVTLKADVISLLLEKGVDPNITGRDRVPFVYRALSFGAYEPEVIRVLIDFQDLHRMGDCFENAIFNAILNPQCQVDAVKLLVGRGSCVQRKDRNDSTPLHLIVGKPYCTAGLVRMLAKDNIYKNDLNHSDLTPMMISMKCRSDLNITNVLFVSGCRVQKVSRYQLYNIIESYIVNFDLTRFQKPDFVRYLKQLVKFALLEKPTFDIDSIPRNLNNTGLLEYTESCLREIEEMIALNIAADCTLYEFVIPSRDVYENPIVNVNAAALSLVELLEAISGHHFPIYWDLIAANISRRVFKEALEETAMYLGVDLLNAPQMKENMSLDYECALKLCACMPNVDVLNLILAYRPGLLH